VDSFENGETEEVGTYVDGKIEQVKVWDDSDSE